MPRPMRPARRFAIRHPPSASALTAATMRSRSAWSARGARAATGTRAAARSVSGRSTVRHCERREPVVRDRGRTCPSRRCTPRAAPRRSRRGPRARARCTGGRRAPRRRRPAACVTPSRLPLRNAALSCRCLVQPSTLVSCTRPMAAWMSVIRLLKPDDLVVVLPLHALVAVQPHQALDLGVGDRDHAALARGHVLGRVEREHRERRRRPPPGCRAGRRRAPGPRPRRPGGRARSASAMSRSIFGRVAVEVHRHDADRARR